MGGAGGSLQRGQVATNMRPTNPEGPSQWPMDSHAASQRSPSRATFSRAQPRQLTDVGSATCQQPAPPSPEIPSLLEDKVQGSGQLHWEETEREEWRVNKRQDPLCSHATLSPWQPCYHPISPMGEQTKTQRRQVSCPGSHSTRVGISAQSHTFGYSGLFCSLHSDPN